MALMRGQGTFEYILLIGSAVLITSLSLYVLLNNQPGVNLQKQCTIAARQSLSCFSQDGSFHNDKTFSFKNQNLPCSCAGLTVPAGGLFGNGASGTATPGATSTANPSGTLVPTATVTPAPTVTATPAPTITVIPVPTITTTPAPSASITPGPTVPPGPGNCQQTTTSCGAYPACQDCTQTQVPAPTSSVPYCQNNNVVHDQTTYAPACQNNACGFSTSKSTITDQTCGSTQVCQSGQCVNGQGVALLVNNGATGFAGPNGISFSGPIQGLNPEEQATLNFLSQYPSLKVNLIHIQDATAANLQTFSAVVATDYYPNTAFNSNAIAQLMGQGKKILLLRDAVGFTDNTQPTSDNANYPIYKNIDFLSKYDVWSSYNPTQINVQIGGNAYSGSGFNWQSNIQWMDGGNTHEAYIPANGNGGTETVWGYDPGALNDEGKIMLDQVIRNTFNLPQYDQAIPAGTVALITQDFSAKQLTPAEQSTLTTLQQNGFTVTQVPQSQRFTTDFSQARIIVAAQGPGFNLNQYFTQWSAKVPLLLLGQGATLTGTSGGGGSYYPVTVWATGNGNTPNQGEAFLSNYDGSSDRLHDITIQQAGLVYGPYHTPDGWIPISDTNGVEDMFYRDVNGIRSAIFSHEPNNLNNEGQIMLDETIRWIKHDTQPALRVPAGNVGLIITDYQNTASLTSDEQNLENQLQAMGLSITVIPQNLRFKTDYSQAVFVAMTEKPYPQTLKFFFGSLKPSIPRVFLMGPAIGILNGAYNSQADAAEVVQTLGPFSSYAPGDVINLADTPTKVWGINSVLGETLTNTYTTIQGGTYIPTTTSGVWSAIGDTGTIQNGAYGSSGNGYALWAGNSTPLGTANNGCGAAIGYYPSMLNSNGKFTLYQMVGWLYQRCYLGSQSQDLSTDYNVDQEAGAISGNNNNPFVCGIGNTQGSTTINIPTAMDIHHVTYAAELISYYLDDVGSVTLNGVPLVNKNYCCNYAQQSGTPWCYGVGGTNQGDCKGGCTWTGTSWACGNVDGSRYCAIPKSSNVMNVLHPGTNTLSANAIDVVYGSPTSMIAKATIRVHQHVG